MAKKTEENGEVPIKTARKKRAKGNFGIFQQVSLDAGPDAGEILWKKVKDGLDSAVACEKHIKEHSEEFGGAVIMVAQVKKVGEVKIKTKISVSF